MTSQPRRERYDHPRYITLAVDVRSYSVSNKVSCPDRTAPSNERRKESRSSIKREFTLRLHSRLPRARGDRYHPQGKTKTRFSSIRVVRVRRRTLSLPLAELTEGPRRRRLRRLRTLHRGSGVASSASTSSKEQRCKILHRYAIGAGEIHQSGK